MALRFVLLALVVVAAVGGCLGAPTASETPNATEASTTTTTVSAPVPDGPAKQFALDAEEDYLESVLSNASCLDSWGTSATVTIEEATVIERSAAGVRVEVRHPYSLSKGTLAADGASEATYRVTENGTERLSGDTLAPC